MAKEEDILCEAGDFFVLRVRQGYEVRQNVGMISEMVVIFPKSDDGLALAKKYCQYRGDRDK